MWCIIPGRKRAHWFIESPSGATHIGCCAQTGFYLIRQLKRATTGDLVCEQCAIRLALHTLPRRRWAPDPDYRRDFRWRLREARAAGQILTTVP